jgi:hypothetical protein
MHLSSNSSELCRVSMGMRPTLARLRVSPYMEDLIAELLPNFTESKYSFIESNRVFEFLIFIV